MSQQIIDTTGTSDTLQSGMTKVNNNFSELYSGISGKQSISTLSADIASIMHSAAFKNTLVNADELVVIDSESGFNFKKTSWSGAKSNLKSYFDVLYNFYELPAPGTTTLGGVKRNEGVSGQYVNGIDTNGALIYDTPAGGGFVTGMEMDYVVDAAPTGWVRKNGLTIGNALSTATERANDDTADLYALLWNNYSDAECPVAGGRGTDAASDFAGGKTLTLPNASGRVSVPKKGSGAFTTMGALVGAETHALTDSENGAHYHSHQYSLGGSSITSDNKGFSAGDTSVVVSASPATESTTSSGNSEPHNNIQPSIVTGCRIIKL